MRLNAFLIVQYFSTFLDSTGGGCAAPHEYLVPPVVHRDLPTLLVTLTGTLSREVLSERVLPERSSPEGPKFLNARDS